MPEKVTEHCSRCQEGRPDCLCNSCKNDYDECCLSNHHPCQVTGCLHYEQEDSI